MHSTIFISSFLSGPISVNRLQTSDPSSSTLDKNAPLIIREPGGFADDGLRARRVHPFFLPSSGW